MTYKIFFIFLFLLIISPTNSESLELRHKNLIPALNIDILSELLLEKVENIDKYLNECKEELIKLSIKN